jgi:hypothetical protein
LGPTARSAKEKKCKAVLTWQRQTAKRTFYFGHISKFFFSKRAVEFNLLKLQEWAKKSERTGRRQRLLSGAELLIRVSTMKNIAVLLVIERRSRREVPEQASSS